jgi:hypothetical protein
MLLMLKEQQQPYWTYEDVEERLVEAALLWLRSPGGGRWPFAGDAPWHLADRELYGPDVDKDEPIRPLPLIRAEVARRDEASAWLVHVPDNNRRLTCLVLMEKARNNGRVGWIRIRRTMNIPYGNEGLRRRYERSIAAIATALTKARIPNLAAAA